MYYYRIFADNGTQYVATTRLLEGENITPITEEQYNIIVDIYAMGDQEHGLPPVGDV